MRISARFIAGVMAVLVLLAFWMAAWLTVFPERPPHRCAEGYVLSRQLLGPDLCLPGYVP